MGAHLEAEQEVTEMVVVAATRRLRPTTGRMNLAQRQTLTRKVMTKKRRTERILERREKGRACLAASSRLLLTWTLWRTVTLFLRRSSLLAQQEIDPAVGLETFECLLHPGS